MGPVSAYRFAASPAHARRTTLPTAVRPDAGALRTLVARMDRHGQPVSAAIESMNGARFVDDQLELAGRDVEIADSLRVGGLAPLAAKTDRIDAWVLADEALTVGLVQAATDASVRSHLMTAGPHQAARFDWDRCAEGTVAAYRTAIGRSGF